MFYNDCLSFKKLFGCVQFTVYVYRSIQRGDILHFDHLRFSAVNRMATRAFKAREKKRQQQNWFFGWIHLQLTPKLSNNKNFQQANATAVRVCCKWIHPFFQLKCNVYIDLGNRERARVRGKKQRRPISLEEKHENFIAAVRKKWEMLAATKVKIPPKKMLLSNLFF